MTQLKDIITQDMKVMMKSGDKQSLKTIRMLLAAVKQKEIDERITLNDEQIIAVVQKMIKQRKDSKQQFESAGREELAEIEAFEISVLQKYMPKQLSREKVVKIIAKAINDNKIDSLKDMGRLMGVLKPQLIGKADMSEVSKIIREKLT